ncbi:MAG: phosphatidate cytidylyltransferase [Bacteroidales bacterium]|nr:phosphatidate cytidylyltransferase [Bacteroidales bacterium]
MSNFWTRTITGLSMVFVLLAALYFSGWVFAAIFLVITILGLWEFYGLISHGPYHPQKLYGTLSGAAIYIISTLSYFLSCHFHEGLWISFLPFIIPLPLFFISFILEIHRKQTHPLINIALTTLGFIYIAIPLSLLNIFSAPGVHEFMGFPIILVGYFSLTWIYDTVAYLYGKQFGKHKFFERISPKKTWEGTIAGGIVTLLAAFFFSVFIKDLTLCDWLIMATLILIFGTYGDLAESLIKRSLNIKDSGNILPGHGGILDRFDTVLISAPFVFLYFFLIQHI